MGRGKVCKSPFALDGFEKEIDRDVGSAAIAVALEEVTAGAGIAEAAEHAEGEVVLVGDAMAETVDAGNRESIAGGLEKAAEDGRIGMLCGGREKIFGSMHQSNDESFQLCFCFAAPGREGDSPPSKPASAPSQEAPQRTFRSFFSERVFHTVDYFKLHRVSRRTRRKSSMRWPECCGLARPSDPTCSSRCSICQLSHEPPSTHSRILAGSGLGHRKGRCGYLKRRSHDADRRLK
jgi:hypothetical protein